MEQYIPRVTGWRPELVGLHAVSDALIAVAYLAILATLIYTAQKRGRAPRIHWMGLLFVLFIVASALMHFLDLWTLWVPEPWLSGALKAVTALASLAVAFLLIPNLPRVLALKSPLELERMNQDLSRATARLARREQQLADALAIASLGAWEWDLTNDRLTWSDQMFRNYGLEPGGEPPGRAWFRERIHPADLERAEAGLAAALEGEDEYVLEYRIHWEDGSLHFIHSAGRVTRDDAGVPVRAYGTSQDVTAQERARAEAQRREAVLADAQAIAHFGSWEWDVQADRVDWSDELYRIYGYEPGGVDVTFGRYLEHVHPDDRDRVAGMIGSALESAGTFEFEERILRPDGSARVLESKGYAVTEGGRAVRIVGTCHDVTEARASEAARRETEGRFRRIVETAQEGIWTIDEGGVTTYVNDRMAEMLGYRPEEMVGRSFYDFMEEDARVEATRNMERRRQGIEERHEFRLKTRSGTELWTYMATSPLMEDGSFLGALAMVMDVTDLREAERSVRVLARAGEILGTSLEPGVTIQQIADLVVEEAADGCFLDLLDAGGRIERAAWSSSTAELNELSALPRLAPAESGTAHPIVQVMTRGKTVYVPQVDDAWMKTIAISDRHYEHLRSAGLRSFLAVPVSARGRILGALLCLRAGEAAKAFTEMEVGLLEEVGRRTGVALDNARLFETLADSEQRYRFLADHSSDMITGHGPEGICTYASPSARELTGYGPDDLVGRSLGEVLHPEGQEAREEDREALADALQSGRVLTIADRIHTRGGAVRWVEATVRGIYEEESGGPQGYIAITRDITERVLAEEELRRREAQLAEAQAIASMGSWEWDIEADRLTWSDEMHRIYGVEPGSIDLDYETFLAFVAPDERARVDQIVRSAFESGQPFEFEHRIRRDDGGVRTILSRGRVEMDARGRVLSMTGIGQDITDRVAAEENLRRSEENYRMLADYSSDMILRFTPEGICTYASPASLILTGFDPSELVGKNASEFIHDDDLQAVAESRRMLLTSFGPHSVMCRLGRKSGGWIWAESTGQGVRDARTGRVETLVTVVRDVTDSVRAARTIRLLEQVAVAANEAVSVRAAMQSALRLVCDYLDWPAGHVYMPERTARGDMAPTDIWHLDQPDKLAEFRQLTEATRFRLGEGLPGRVLETGRPAWVEDIDAEPGLLRAAALAAAGIRSAFAFPVRAGNETLAVLEFFSTAPGAAEPDLLDVMDNVGTQLGQVLQRQRTETALRASEQQFRALAESAVEAIVTADSENRVTYCNDSVTRLFGWRAEELVGQPLTTLIPERLREAHLTGFKRFVQTRESSIIGRPVELVAMRQDGEEFPIELSLAWWEGSDGLQFAGIIRDITERKKAEESLGEKLEELARSNAELGLFTYVASHDLREPLRTVGSNLQLVMRRLGPDMEEGVRRSIDYALGGVRRMQALIDDLLIYSRVGTEGKPFMPVDAGQALSEAEASLKVAIEESGAGIEAESLPRVLGDQSQIVQLFQNLLSNAIKFQRDGIPPRVRVLAVRAGALWEFSVQDNGIGIDPAYAEHVFTIFQRLQSADRYPGTGIGLAVCRKIVERHGGRIWVEPTAGGGATLRFTLPALRR